jgi:hypothetical protein
VQRLVRTSAMSGRERLVGPAAWMVAVVLVAGPTWFVLR